MQLKRYDENTIKNKGEKVYTEYLKLIKSGNIQVGLEVALDNLKMNRTKFISILMQYIERQDEADDYSRVFAELLSSSDPRQYLKDNNIPADFLSSNLNNYLYYKRPDILFGNKNILKILNSLIEYNNKLWREREKEIKDKETILPFVENIIQEFLNQDYSLERFCIQKNIGKNLLNPSDGYYIRELALYNKELYQKFIDDITIRESNKNKTIQDDIYKILTMLKDNINLDSIDFYLATKYGPVEFIEKAEAILPIEDSRIIRDFINKFKYGYITNYRKCNLRQELINDKYTININGTLVETTPEDRSEILDFLEENFIPITSMTVFQDACKRYYRNELLNSKARSIQHD